MTFIKKAYFYLFYKFYKFGSHSGPFPNDFSAGVLIVILEMLILGILKFYYIGFIDQNDTIKPFSVATIVPLLAVFLINYFSFVNNDKWKEYVKEFDKLPRYKNIIGTWVVLMIVAFILVNVVISFNMMGKIAANRYNHK
jgi:hypothetical protein